MKDQLVLMITAVLQKKNSINFSKVKTNFCLSLHYNGDQSYLFLDITDICKIKANDNISWYNVLSMKGIL